MNEKITALLEDLNSLHNKRLLEIDIDCYVEKIIKNAAILCHFDRGNLEAFIAYYCNDPQKETSYLTMLAVSPQAQRKGLGRRLLQFVIENLKSTGFRHLWLEVLKDNVKAIQLYESAGFTIARSTSEGKIAMEI